VKPNVSQKAPNVPKTTKGKVLPIIHCDDVQLDMLQESLENIAALTYLADRAKYHEYATKTEVGTNRRCTVTASTTPSHECARQWCQGQEETGKCSIPMLVLRIEALILKCKLTGVSGCRMSCGDRQQLCSAVTDRSSRTAPERWTSCQ
jgi:hypothetical protein